LAAIVLALENLLNEEEDLIGMNLTYLFDRPGLPASAKVGFCWFANVSIKPCFV
jgi:hypothetical protein